MNNSASGMDTGFDVIVIGGGHNGLVCANYLQKAGHKTLVLERRGIVGGAVCTEEMFPGYKVDVGSSVHIMVHQTADCGRTQFEGLRFGILPDEPVGDLSAAG